MQFNYIRFIDILIQRCVTEEQFTNKRNDIKKVVNSHNRAH
jgi:hypothetical protein